MTTTKKPLAWSRNCDRRETALPISARRRDQPPYFSIRPHRSAPRVRCFLASASGGRGSMTEAAPSLNLERARDPLVRCIAFHLSQFHPIPENDQWWGKGFTEWTNVTRARPNFVGHYQPHLPADLGFYDLRLPEVRSSKPASLGRMRSTRYRYYYYWFAGKRLLERPVEEMRTSGKPDFPYCFCWANENWTRRWDGADNEILIAQNRKEPTTSVLSASCCLISAMFVTCAWMAGRF